MENKLLSSIKTPGDVKKLSAESLPLLASEIRSEIIDTVSSNGGHLASNLGVVELTVALHRVFNSPKDKIIWDVGHQVYAHKLLTGRFDDFHTLRKEGGISGFSRPNESEHDIVYSGHSSTSVSTALGIAVANAVNGSKDYAIAVLGDGALTGGLVYEAINNTAKEQDARLIIILNDNGMSISQNVGHLARTLASMRSNRKYFRMKSIAEKIISRIPLFGTPLANRIFKIKTDVKNVIYQSNMFESFGVRYMGPIDGHNIEKLCDALEAAKTLNSPVVLHINTVKGMGYEPAENNPSAFHGVGAFDKNTGTLNSSDDNFSEKFGEFLYNQAAKDKRICGITAAMSLGTGLKRFANEYENRFFDVGIAEEHALPFALGLSKSGMLPVFVVYSTFLQRCYDQIIHDFALQNLKAVIAVDRAGIVGDDGETHNGIYDVSFFNGIPNITVYSPSCYSELNKDFVNSLYHINGPAVVRYPRGKEPALPDDFEVTGNDFDVYGDANSEIAVVTYGRIFVNACTAKEKLKENGVNVRIIKLNKIIPLSPDLVKCVSGCSNIFFFEESVKSGGIGERFASMLFENGVFVPYVHTAIQDTFVKQGKPDEVLKRYSLDGDGIERIITSHCKKAEEILN